MIKRFIVPLLVGGFFLVTLVGCGNSVPTGKATDGPKRASDAPGPAKPAGGGSSSNAKANAD